MTNSASPDSDTRTSAVQHSLYMFISAVKDIPDVTGVIFDFAVPQAESNINGKGAKNAVLFLRQKLLLQLLNHA